MAIHIWTAAMLLGLLWGGAAHAETIHVGGTGSALEALRRLGEAFSQQRPDIRLIVLPSLGSKGGLRALAAGRIDLAVSAAPVAEPESGDRPRVRAWARSPFAIAVREDVPVRDLSTEDLVEIYSARRLTWPDGSRIRPVLRPTTDSATVTLRGLGPGMAEAVAIAERLWGTMAAVTDQDAATALETVPGAISPIVVGQFIAERRKARLVVLDGAEPTVAALAAGTYPHSKTYWLAAPEPPKDGVAAFLAYLESDAGRDMAAALGFLAVDER